MVTDEVRAYAAVLKAAGLSELRAVRRLKARFPTMETCHALEALEHVPEPGLWAVPFNALVGDMEGSNKSVAFVPRKPWEPWK